ncbi:energy-coupling factor transporter ATPase [Gemella sp. zg-1178]|uniref:energy-coupling factor transporter ATPase n=1 Tax=Gemella sp. zg-1178 TaxID=2840372 RepID=UPI001C03ED49|nr:energy-coupling factor transporter ATPase [Gemella sp. zg-1178]MBU0278018.1 energy-coupling factor transporter ATPase [Gemella sp. zg-1178]
MLKFEDVSFTYPNTNIEVLKNISFEISKGEWVSILGNNGSGKSTIAKLITAQYEKNSGQICLDNKIYSRENLEYIRNNIAIVFQNPDNQFVGATVEEDIAFGLENRNIDSKLMDKIISEVLDVVDMKDFRKKEPKDLSGGQKQRVAIASALALKPKILILDEASSMLDPEAREKILKYLKKINVNHNITIISISHDVEELVYSDSVILMNNGALIQKTNAAEIFKNINLLKKYSLKIPFLYRLKQDLSKYINNNIFDVNDNMEVTISKLCKLNLTR